MVAGNSSCGLLDGGLLQFCVATLGTERIVYSVDYRFVGNEGAAEFLAAAEFSDDAKEAVAHGTAEPLGFKLTGTPAKRILPVVHLELGSVPGSHSDAP